MNGILDLSKEGQFTVIRSFSILMLVMITWRSTLCVQSPIKYNSWTQPSQCIDCHHHDCGNGGVEGTSMGRYNWWWISIKQSQVLGWCVNKNNRIGFREAWFDLLLIHLFRSTRQAWKGLYHRLKMESNMATTVWYSRQEEGENLTTESHDFAPKKRIATGFLWETCIIRIRVIGVELFWTCDDKEPRNLKHPFWTFLTMFYVAMLPSESFAGEADLAATSCHYEENRSHPSMSLYHQLYPIPLQNWFFLSSSSSVSLSNPQRIRSGLQSKIPSSGFVTEDTTSIFISLSLLQILLFLPLILFHSYFSWHSRMKKWCKRKEQERKIERGKDDFRTRFDRIFVFLPPRREKKGIFYTYKDPVFVVLRIIWGTERRFIEEKEWKEKYDIKWM